jgi:hypothetical protein
MISQQNFKQLLKDFFTVNHPRQIKKIDAIATEFKGQEVEVLQYLCKKYKVATNKVAGLDEAILQKATAKKQVIEEKVEENDSATNSEITEENND